MRERLYARDALVLTLVPRLVGLAYDRQRAVQREHPGDLPAVLMTGRHGMGRTAVLEALADAYRGRIPLGRADLAALRTDDRTALGTSNTSAMVETLQLLVEGLAPAVPGFGRLRFPRLLPGLFAVSTWHRGRDEEQNLARARISRLSAACGLGDSGQAGEAGPQWLADVGVRLAEADSPGDLPTIAALNVELFLARHTGRRGGRTVTAWYEERVEGAADGTEALVRLALRFHRGGDFRRAVERVLMTAFLDDLADAYTGWKGINRAPRPLVLLDNAHTEAGRSFLDPLLEIRAENGRRRFDPLVVVAGLLGDAEDRYPDAIRRSLPEIAASSGWARVPGSPSAGLLAVALPPLDRDDLLAMLDDTPRALHAHLPTALHHLTGGQPLACRLLCDAVAHAAADRSVVPEELLDLTTPDGHPVTEHLLERLIPEPQIREQLTLLSPAADREAAHALAAGCAPRGADLFPADSAARYLYEECWAPAGDRPFVADPFLRTVLVHQLRRDPQAVSAGRRWAELHGILREHHAALGERGEADVLHHTLATGDAATVVLRLAESFGLRDAARWLRELQQVATAPHPPPAEWTDERREIARGGHDGRYPAYDEIQRSVNRLLHALWYLAEETTHPDRDLCTDMGAELTFLSMRHPTGRAVLNQAAREWPTAARQRLRPYPVPAP